MRIKIDSGDIKTAEEFCMKKKFLFAALFGMLLAACIMFAGCFKSSCNNKDDSGCSCNGSAGSTSCTSAGNPFGGNCECSEKKLN